VRISPTDGRPPDALATLTGGPRRRESPAVNDIMPEPAPHGWAYLLALVDAIRRLAYDRWHRTMRCAASGTGSASTTAASTMKN
jgi:hypothetical protein